MADIKAGDRVRVVIEGEVDRVNIQDILIGKGEEGRNAIFAKNPDDYTVTIEKIEPPVEVFKPGDVVREKGGPDSTLRALGQDGYIRLDDGRFFDYDDAPLGAYGAAEFTTDQWERVSIG